MGLKDYIEKKTRQITKSLMTQYQQASQSQGKGNNAYGQLNAKGDFATLSDGSTLDVISTGRPGTYTPIFKLGAGKGLADEPEQVFITADSNADNPYVVVVGWSRLITEDSRSIALKGVWIIDKLGNAYALPENLYPPSMASIPSYKNPQFEVTCCAGFGGFSVVVYCSTYKVNTKQATNVPPPLFPDACFLNVSSFALRDGMIVVAEQDYQKGRSNYNQYLDGATEQFNQYFPGNSTLVSSPACYTTRQETVTISNIITNTYGSANYLCYLKIIMRGLSDSGIVTDLSIMGQTSYTGGLSSVGRTFTSDGTEGPGLEFTWVNDGVFNVELASVTSETLYDITFLYTNTTITSAGGSESSTTTTPPAYYTFILRNNFCISQAPTGPFQYTGGGRQYSKVIKNWLTGPSAIDIDFLDYDPSSTIPDLRLPMVVAAIPLSNSENFKSIVSNQGSQFSSSFVVSLRDGYSSSELYSTPINRSQSNFYYDIVNYPVGYNDGVILYGTGGNGSDELGSPLFLNRRAASFTRDDNNIPGFNGSLFLQYMSFLLGLSGYGTDFTFNFYSIRVENQDYTITKAYSPKTTIADLFPVYDPLNDKYTYSYGFR